MAATKTCDLADDCGDFSDEQLPECEQFTKISFEDADQPFGFFAPDSELGQFSWSRGHGGRGREGAGPPFDHTHFNQEGHYLYIDSAAQVSSHWWTDTILTSDWWRPPGPLRTSCRRP